MTSEEARDHGGGCSVALMLGLSPAFLGPCLLGLGAVFPWTWPLCMAYFSGMVCVLAIWLAIGKSPLWLRLPAAMLPGTAVGVVVFGLGYSEMPERERMIEIAVFTLLVPAASLPSFGLRSLGYRLVLPWNEREGEPTGDAKPLQFSLRQLFALTAAVALYAFFAKLLAGNDARFSDEAASEMLLFVHLSLSASGATWAALGRARAVARLLLIAVISGSLMLVLALSFGARESEALFGVVWLTLHPLVIGAALWLFREIGYRLVRMPPAENAGPEKTPI